jgi:hypothetical protein
MNYFRKTAHFLLSCRPLPAAPDPGGPAAAAKIQNVMNQSYIKKSFEISPDPEKLTAGRENHKLLTFCFCRISNIN